MTTTSTSARGEEMEGSSRASSDREGPQPREQQLSAPLEVLDLFSCIGCHAIGLDRVGGFKTVAFCESNPWRRARLAERFPGVPIHDDARTLGHERCHVIFGGPPCQNTSVAAAIHGYRSGETLWPEQRRLTYLIRPEWVVVEQPSGNALWEAEVAHDLAAIGYHSARLEFEARDVGAPFERRRVFILASPSKARLEVAWKEGPSAIERVARAADARGAWDADILEALSVDARSAGEHDRGPRSRERQEWIEALGDSNPPGMAEVIGHCLIAGARTRPRCAA
jgi:site-specific DNA-cytosine methylase